MLRYCRLLEIMLEAGCGPIYLTIEDAPIRVAGTMRRSRQERPPWVPASGIALVPLSVPGWSRPQLR